MKNKKSKNKKNANNLPRTVRRMFPNVETCTDSNSPVTITVQKKDVSSARRMQADGCAMAKALCREKGVDGAIVGLGYTYLIKGNKAVRFQTTETVAREITSFDRHDDFAPGTYKLSAVPPSQRREVAAARARENSAARRREKTDNRKRHDAADTVKRVVHSETLRVRSMRRKDAAA